MNNERAKRDEMSETRNPPSGARGRQSQPDIDNLRAQVSGALSQLADALRRLDAHDARLNEGGDEMNALATSIDNLATDVRDMRRSTSETNSVLLTGMSNLNERVGKILEVAAFSKSGRDIENKTPSGKLPGISVGNVRAWAPPWLFGALMSLALVLVAAVAAVIGVAYFGHK